MGRHALPFDLEEAKRLLAKLGTVAAVARAMNENESFVRSKFSHARVPMKGPGAPKGHRLELKIRMEVARPFIMKGVIWTLEDFAKVIELHSERARQILEEGMQSGFLPRIHPTIQKKYRGLLPALRAKLGRCKTYPSIRNRPEVFNRIKRKLRRALQLASLETT